MITIRLLHIEGFIFAECPMMPGCYAQGNSETEALDNIYTAMKSWIDSHNYDICEKIKKSQEQKEISVDIQFSLAQAEEFMK